MSESISYLLIGGYAAARAAGAIRKIDQQGSIVLLTQEEHPPYERPPLSKELLFEENFQTENTYAQAENFYQGNSIGLRTATKVTSIDRVTKTVQLEGGELLTYEKLFLAPGAVAKKPEFPGSNFENVYTLRNIGDSRDIRAAIEKGGKVVIIGGSYLGLEAASGCLKKGLDVTVIDSHPGPWAKFSSPVLQKFVTQQYEKAGTKFLFNQRTEKIEGEGQAQSVFTEEQMVPCDFVIAATGSKLNLDLAKATRLDVDEKMGIIVDEHYQTSDPSIWSAGDAVHYPDPVVGKMWHNEHFINACWSGEIAGANMAGENQKLDRAPYFFSDFLDLHMVMRGSPGTGKSARIVGDLEAGEFVELYADESGVLKMGVIISHHKIQSEAHAEKLEALVKNKAGVEKIDSTTFGF